MGRVSENYGTSLKEAKELERMLEPVERYETESEEEKEEIKMEKVPEMVDEILDNFVGDLRKTGGLTKYGKTLSEEKIKEKIALYTLGKIEKSTVEKIIGVPNLRAYMLIVSSKSFDERLEKLRESDKKQFDTMSEI